MEKKRLKKKISLAQKSTGKTLKQGQQPAPSVPYLPFLNVRLQDPEYSAGYLSECLNDSHRIFLVGLKNVVEARGGFTKVAKKASVTREHLYRMLSPDGNPTLVSLIDLLDALEIKLSLQADKGKAA